MLIGRFGPRNELVASRSLKQEVTEGMFEKLVITASLSWIQDG